MADDETEPIRPEVLTSQVELASLRVKNWLAFFALLSPRINQRLWGEIELRLYCPKRFGLTSIWDEQRLFPGIEKGRALKKRNRGDG